MSSRLLAMKHFWELPYGQIATWCAGLSYVAYQIYKGWKDEQKKESENTAKKNYGDPEVIKRTARQDERIHELLTELRQHVDACRVCIYSFHNGHYFYSGSPLEKMTCTYESCAGGFSRILEDQQGLMVSMMSGIVQTMFEDSPLVTMVKDMNDSYAKTLLEDLNIQMFACLPLRQDKMYIGCLQIHWFSNSLEMDDRIVEEKCTRTVNAIEHRMIERLQISGIGKAVPTANL